MIELARAAARFLLPSDCLACGGPAQERLCAGGVCAACWESLPGRPGRRCARCDEALPGGSVGAAEPLTCGRCLLDPPPFESLRAAAPYAGSARDDPPRVQVPRRRLSRRAPGRRHDAGGSRRRRRTRSSAVPGDRAAPAARRGYHAAEALARSAVPPARDLPSRAGASSSVARPRSRAACRSRSDAPTCTAPSGPPDAPRDSVLLVDDVATSGATARECARRLAAAGARRIVVWCFARASRGDVPPEAA